MVIEPVIETITRRYLNKNIIFFTSSKENNENMQTFAKKPTDFLTRQVSGKVVSVSRTGDSITLIVKIKDEDLKIKIRIY